MKTGTGNHGKNVIQQLVRIDPLGFWDSKIVILMVPKKKFKMEDNSATMRDAIPPGYLCKARVLFKHINEFGGRRYT